MLSWEEFSNQNVPDKLKLLYTKEEMLTQFRSIDNNFDGYIDRNEMDRAGSSSELR
jgi:Ca2+-binding EF-hand superfamily protein